jgi:hypothetical protein
LLWAVVSRLRHFSLLLLLLLSRKKWVEWYFTFFTTFQRAVEKQLDSIPRRLVKGEIWDFFFRIFSLVFFGGKSFGLICMRFSNEKG